MYKDDRPPVVVEIEDETDADMIAVLHDWSIPIGINMVNIGVGKSAFTTQNLFFTFNLSLSLMTSLALADANASSYPARGSKRLEKAVRCPCYCARR